MSPVKSLRELSIMAIFQNIRQVDNIGYLSYDTVRSILLRVESAAQLRQIELNSPQIQGQTAELWVRLIERDFPLESRNRAYQPKDPKNWYKVWEKYKVEQEKFLEESENRLKSALNSLRQEEEKKTSKIIELGAIPSSKKGAIKRPHARTSNTLSFGGGSRTKTANGASVMRKVRREAKEIAQIHGTLSRPIRTPPARSAVTKAPEAMVNDHKRAALPPYRPALLKEPLNDEDLDPVLLREFEIDPESRIEWLSEAALENYERRASYLSDADESGDSGHAQPKQPASAAPKPAAKPAARPAAPKAPMTSLQRKFGGSKSALRAPLAPSAPVIKAREPEPKPESEQSKAKRPRLRPYPAPDLPKAPTSSSCDEEDQPESWLEVLDKVDAKVEAEREARAPAGNARVAQIIRKRNNPDLFATHPRKKGFR